MVGSSIRSSPEDTIPSSMAWSFTPRDREMMVLLDFSSSESEREDESDWTELKRLANVAYRDKKYGEAIRLYTLALQQIPRLDTADNLEARRILLANRGQTYQLSGDLYTAMRDIELALSPQYTRPNSSKMLTLKCHFRRAKVLFSSTRFVAATKEYDVFKRLKNELGISVDSADTVELGRLLDHARHGSGPCFREQLMQAVDARGLLMKTNYRYNFPWPTNEMLRGHMFRESDPTLSFIRQVDPKSDLALAPLAYPVVITAPYFIAHSRPSNVDFTRLHPALVPEHVPISSFLDNLFRNAMRNFPSGEVSEEEHREYMQSASDHDNPSASIVVVQTFYGRMFVVPRSATIKQIITGCRWPRQDRLPFKDLRQRSRRLDNPVDGMELICGVYLEFSVIPRKQRAQYVDYMEKKYRFHKTR